MLKYVTWVEIMDDNFIRIKSKLKLVELVVAERWGNTPSDPTVYCAFNKKTVAAGVSSSPTVNLACTYQVYSLCS